jgi:hypothetical protein
MPNVVWKDLIWSGLDRDMGIKELLTILKGYGPMELLSFEKPGACRGELNVWIDENEVRNLTLFHLEVYGAKRRGIGRDALRHLREIFGGDIYVQHPGYMTSLKQMDRISLAAQPNRDSAMFWIKMFEEGLIQAIEDDFICLHQNTSAAKLETLKKEVTATSNSGG